MTALFAPALPEQEADAREWRTGHEAVWKWLYVTLIAQPQPGVWTIAGPALQGTRDVPEDELGPMPDRKAQVATEPDARHCYPNGKPVQVGDLVRVTVPGHRAGSAPCEVEKLYSFGSVGLRQGKSTYAVTGSVLEFVGRKSEGVLPDVDEAQPMPDVDADVEPVTPFRTVPAPREVSVEDLHAAEAVLVEAKAKREPDAHRHSMLDVFDRISAEVAAEEAAEAAALRDREAGLGEQAFSAKQIFEAHRGSLASRAIVEAKFVTAAGRLFVTDAADLRWNEENGCGEVRAADEWFPVTDLGIAELSARERLHWQRPDGTVLRWYSPLEDSPLEELAHVEAIEAAPVVVATEPAAPEEVAGPVAVLSLGQIRVDGGTQARAGVNWSTVTDYAELMADGVEFPALTVYFDGAEYWLADGFHRYHAAKQLALAELAVDVRKGDARAARLHAASANATHGLPRTNEDKRRAVLLLLNDQEWAQWSDREIARRCMVSDRMVNNVRKQLTANGSQSPAERKGADGRTINTAGISAANAERAAKPAPEPSIPTATYTTGEPVRLGDVVQHIWTKAHRSHGAEGVITGLYGPTGTPVNAAYVRWSAWDGEAQEHTLTQPIVELVFMRRASATAPVSVEPERIVDTATGEIVTTDPIDSATPEVTQVPAATSLEWLTASVLVNADGLLCGVVLKAGSQTFKAYYLPRPEKPWDRFATHQQAVEFLKGKVR